MQNFRTETVYKLDLNKRLSYHDDVLFAFYRSEDQCFQYFSDYVATLSQNKLENLIQSLAKLNDPIKNITFSFKKSINSYYDDNGFGDYYPSENACIIINFDLCSKETIKKQILGVDGIYYQCLVEQNKSRNKNVSINILEEKIIFPVESNGCSHPYR